MLLLLPPSEAKRPGGAPGSRLELDALRFPALRAARRATIDAAAALAVDEAASIAALKLGPRQHDEVAKNRVLETSATMPALDRYTGVLFDALDVPTLPSAARERLGRIAVVHSAVLGLVGLLDAIPDYRLSPDSRLPGLVLKRIWADAVAAELANVEGLILDARSQGYLGLGPAPDRPDSLRLAVVSEDEAGRRRALNHFNKHAKGELARALALSDDEPDTAAELVEWGAQHGMRLEHSAAREITLVVG